MSDANGATSSAALTITITGTNDAPVAVADGKRGDAVTESGGAWPAIRRRPATC